MIFAQIRRAARNFATSSRTGRCARSGRTRAGGANSSTSSPALDAPPRTYVRSRSASVNASSCTAVEPASRIVVAGDRDRVPLPARVFAQYVDHVRRPRGASTAAAGSGTLPRADVLLEDCRSASVPRRLLGRDAAAASRRATSIASRSTIAVELIVMEIDTFAEGDVRRAAVSMSSRELIGTPTLPTSPLRERVVASRSRSASAGRRRPRGPVVAASRGGTR